MTCETSGDEEVKDFRGVPITIGCTVVTPTSLGGRLVEKKVKRLERPGKPEWWVNVRFYGGGYTTPDRVAVVR